ncbi:acyltransferase [Pseudoalteromonas carrageenovora]|uniref:acyltransferase family protein n=1 Tax=Pseudoalteromonas carrageenovora TaxID=227 RepID=UPI00311F2426
MNRRFEALDAFRGICAISVVIFHMHLVNSITELNFFRGSSVFVEFFFILSGFVLVHSYGEKKNINFKSFMKARFFRIYPLHLLMLTIFIVLESSKLLAYKFGGISFNNPPFTNDTAFGELLPNLLLIHSWTPFTDPLSFNYPSWSISIEFYIYALLFSTIVFFKTNKAIAWFCISAIAFSMIYLRSDLLVESVLKGLSCFFGGAVTYLLFKKVSYFKLSSVIGTSIEFLLIILIVIIVSVNFKYKSLIAPFLFLITVFFFAFEAGLISQLLRMKLFQTTGKLSYSIYMTHAAILFCLTSLGIILQKSTTKNIAPMIDSQRYLDFGGSSINNIIILITLTLIIYISNLTYNAVEVKGLALNRK